MRFLRFSTYILLVLLGIGCASTEDAVQQDHAVGSAGSNERVTELISNLPARNHDETQWVFSELIDEGPSGVRALMDMLVAPGNGNDTQARLAVNGLTKFVSRSGAESEQRMYERALLDGLQSDYHYAVNRFIMEQLELVGSNEAVPVLSTFIGKQYTNEPAVHALRSIHTGQAEEALVEALSNGKVDNQPAVVLKALGDMEVALAVESIVPYASSEDWETRKSAWYALAQSAKPDAEEALKEAVVSSGGYHKIEAERYYLMWIEQLAEEGFIEESADNSMEILTGDYGADAKSSALAILVEVNGSQAMEEVVKAAEGSADRLRATALSLIKKSPEIDIPQRWFSELDDDAPEVQADILPLVAQSAQASVSVFRPYLDSPHEEVRIAAAQALIALNNQENVTPLLLEALQEAENPDEVAAMQSILLQLPTEPLLKAVAKTLPSAEKETKVALVEILDARRATDYREVVVQELDSSDEQVRIAVYRALDKLSNANDLPQMITILGDTKTEKEREVLLQSIVGLARRSSNADSVIVDEMSGLTDDKTKASVIGILPEVGGEAALNAVINARNSDQAAVADQAGKALASWPNPSALAPTFKAFTDASDAQRRLLLQGYIRLVSQSKYSSEDKARFLQDAYDEAANRQEKKTVLDGLASLESPEAFKILATHFEDSSPEIREESLRSAAQILAQNKDYEQQLAYVEAGISSQAQDKLKEYVQQIKSREQQTDNFASLFNGEDLSGWIGNKDSYRVESGQIVSKEGASGNLFTEQEYSDFILRFEFKLSPGANNGLGIRSPLEGNPAYDAMELQIIDNEAEKYSELEPYQYHGSVYGVAPAERGYLNPAGEWNTQEVIADGSEITVKVNGETILNTNLEEVGNPETLDGKEHPGLFRESGHIGFLGHGDEVAFRNIRIRDLNVYYPDYSSDSGNGNDMNQPPEGFTALFNGENLEGWKGLVGNPESRSKMNARELAEKQKEANVDMRRHWSVRNGVLTFDGKGHSLVTEKKYKDFEMMVDWKIEPGGDSGIYLRGTPQVQIWDITENPVGSGGLFNNKNHPSVPLVRADNAIGEWNKMRIKMVGEKVTVHLNDQLVVDNVVLENYWDRDEPIYSEGQIELQAHNTPLYFKNIFIREIPRWTNLVKGNQLTGWQKMGSETGEWKVENGILYTEGGSGWLGTENTYDDFKLELEYRLPEGGNSGIFLRAPNEGNPAYEGIEIQLLDDNAEQYSDLEPWQYTGSIYDVKAPSQKATEEAGEWQKMQVTVNGPKIKVRLNGQIIINTTLVNYMDRVAEHPGLKRRSGHIGLQNHDSRVEFRNVKIKELK